MSKLSIIIPTYNEANNLPLLLSDLSIFKKKIEIIIVDSNSKDKTKDIATIYGAKLYKSNKKNRGLQLNIGAQKSNGDWLFFIHADSRLKENWFHEISSITRGSENFIYFFKFKICDKKIIYRLLEAVVNIRSSIFKKPYGDQGLIISRETYFKNKGFKKIPIMEDIDFIRRLRNKNDLKMLGNSIYTSSRKWEKTNIFFQAFKNWKFRKRWFEGDSIRSIYNDYYKN